MKLIDRLASGHIQAARNSWCVIAANNNVGESYGELEKSRCKCHSVHLAVSLQGQYSLHKRLNRPSLRLTNIGLVWFSQFSHQSSDLIVWCASKCHEKPVDDSTVDHGVLSSIAESSVASVLSL